MNDIKDKDTLNHACELDPRYQNLMAAFRQAVKRENIEQIQTYLLILLISRKLLAEEQALFDRYNLSEGKLSVLLLLKNAPQNQLTPSEIAEATQVTRGTMTGLLAGLERDGYVTRSEYPSDGRRCAIQLTERSLEVIDQLLLERFQHIEKLFSCFTPAELAEQRTIIEKLNYQLIKDSFYG
jgi:DNA-binding MarR family transcriptional regulator